MEEEIKEPDSFKILLMGKSSAGKTAMKSIIFANKLPQDTLLFGHTSEISIDHFKFLENSAINLWDCSGANEYAKEYFDTKKEQIFSKVNILVFVIKAENKNENEEIIYFEK